MTDADSEIASGDIIYVLTNPAMPGLVKIGKTRRADVTPRIWELFATGVPLPFECVKAVRVSNGFAVEQALHAAFQPQRIHPRREFFEIEPDQAVAVLDVLAIEDVTPEVSHDASAQLDSVDRAASDNAKRKRRPNLRFPDLGIPLGAELVCTVGEQVATVNSETKVDYEGEGYSLTPLTKMLRGSDAGVDPTRFWTYQGRSLNDMYREAHP